uniref:Toxin-antitoxin system, toxin component, Txe/YoeB family n=1 Tax=Candidatus Kentrum eta TaxID=2126337 RepID=A0A450UA59_9GAMM|nr:MAG: toxin-antitoxin system, toxin component, Txe/YoeB family [Candidatus Kentron sp. H]VFJ88995.1 MAG: toxin-antitoxin system, toxin component, Txe/YoeB family [Candidatus Kentron sp. H]VFJ95729.1 MAG: toxin-antitoxin system, toxin component, Txe/YoeB family [Candidatus Kentron sp. H]
MRWSLVYTKQAQKDAKKLAASGFEGKTRELLRVLEENPYRTPPPFEKLAGDLAGAYSRRITSEASHQTDEACISKFRKIGTIET